MPVLAAMAPRYADPGTYLFTSEQWEGRRAGFCALVRKPAGAAEAIEQVKEELHQALGDLEETLANASPGDVVAVRLDDEGRLVVPPLSAEDVRPRPGRCGRSCRRGCRSCRSRPC